MIKNLIRLSNLNLFYSSLIVMAIFSVAILDVAGLGLFFIFINTFITNSFSSYFENPMIDTLLSLNSSYFLLSLSFVYISKFILSILLQFLISKVALREQYELKAKLLKKLSNLNLYNLINLNNSKLLNILSNHMNIFSNSLESFLRLISDIFFVIRSQFSCYL